MLLMQIWGKRVDIASLIRGIPGKCISVFILYVPSMK